MKHIFAPLNTSPNFFCSLKCEELNESSEQSRLQLQSKDVFDWRPSLPSPLPPLPNSPNESHPKFFHTPAPHYKAQLKAQLACEAA